MQLSGRTLATYMQGSVLNNTTYTHTHIYTHTFTHNWGNRSKRKHCRKCQHNVATQFTGEKWKLSEI